MIDQPLHRRALLSTCFTLFLCTLLCTAAFSQEEPVSIADRWQLFASDRLVHNMQGDAELRLHRPTDEGPVLKFDKPWEGGYSAHVTVLKDQDQYRLYYRGFPVDQESRNAVVCYAESPDGKNWTRPDLTLHEVQGTRKNNVILADPERELQHNFSPFIDNREGVPSERRYKAVARAEDNEGLLGYVSGDGIHWKLVQEEPIITDSGWVFDSQNVAFWSSAEQRYVMYYRKSLENRRSIARATSKNFLDWSGATSMRYSDTDAPVPRHHMYTNQTHPYFRNNHLYISTAARFMNQRRVLSEQQADRLGLVSAQRQGISDAILMTTRPGSTTYNRTFREAFIRPGPGARNWGARSNYPALHIVPTGKREMSIYVNKHYAQPRADLHRYSMRIDGLASVHAGASGGELVTRPVRFQGDALEVNFSTSAAGEVNIALRTADGVPIDGFSGEQSARLIGDDINHRVEWPGDRSLDELAGTPVRLKFYIKDGDLYSFRFTASGDDQ